MSGAWPVVVDRSFLSLRLRIAVVCIAHHLRMMKHTLSTQSNLRRMALLSSANRAGRASRLFGTFGPAVGCLHEQRQLRPYTGTGNNDVQAHDNGLTKT